MQSGICEGCGRHIDEISAWQSLTFEERQHVVAVSKERMEKNLVVALE